MLNVEKARLITKICNLYYYEGLTQQEIANKIGIDRPRVSRMITAAKGEGIVNISIKNPFSEELKLEKALIEEYGLDDAIVIDTFDYGPADTYRQLAAALTMLLDTILKENYILGVSAGTTINAISEEIGYITCKGMKVVPLVGGWGPYGDRAQSNLNARNFAEKFKCDYFQLDAPAFVATNTIRDHLLKEPTIHAVLENARKSNIALVSIGRISEDEMVVHSGPISREEVKELIEKNAIASVVGSFLDKTGACIEFSGSSRIIGLEGKDLKKIPKVIGIASGIIKVGAITAALKSGFLNMLTTNMKTAKAILENSHKTTRN